MALEKTFQWKHVLLLNTATMLIGTSAVIARYMNIAPKLGIFGRSSIAFITLTLFILALKSDFSFNRKDLFILIGSGCLMAIHWVLYFFSLEQTSVAIGVITIFTYPIWTVLLEPILLKTKFDPINLILAFAILFGVYLLVPPQPSSKMLLGILSGIVSAVAYSIRNIYSKKILSQYNGYKILWFQAMVVVILLLPFIDKHEYPIMFDNGTMLLILGVLTTAVGHGFMVTSLKYFSVGQAGILASLQPLYSILLGMIVLGEFPAGNIIIGGLIILSVVLFEVYRSATNKT
ncbi:MAG TPA: DMT family transporter [Saprospiraceae bacterium]|nr:DMT family transporter [Saprospiraceae bacterium]HPN68600.1 DMT family transporter [Saprospiraceae bacterium]